MVPSDGNTHAPDAQETVRPAGPLVPDVLVPSQPGGGSGPQTTCVPQGSDISLSVLSFNTHSAQGRNGVEMEQIAREIEAWDPDVVLLQEVDRNRASSRRTDQPGYYAQQLGMEVAFGVNVLHQGNGRVRRRDPVEVPHRRQSNTHLPTTRASRRRSSAAS